MRTTYSSVYNTSAKGTPAPVAGSQAATYSQTQATQTTTYNSRGATAPPVSTASAASQAGSVVVKVSGTTTSRITTPAVVAGNVTTTSSSGNTNRVGTPAVTTYAATSGTSRTLSTPAVTHDAASLQAARSTLTKNLTAPKAEESSLMDGVHKVLDGVGYVPAVGDLADLINSVIYAVEGDWSDAVISAAAMFIDGATAGRLARNSMEIAGEAVEAVTKRAVKNGTGKVTGEVTEDIGQEIAEEIWDEISEYLDEDNSKPWDVYTKQIYERSIDVSGWNKGSFDEIEESVAYHYYKHANEDGASSIEQYIRKAEGFKLNLRGAKKCYVDGSVNGVVRYKKGEKYIDLASEGTIVSFGTIE